jgi:hypothetical protein
MSPARKLDIVVLFAVGSLLTVPAKAQKLSVGVVGGGSVTDAFSTSLVSSSFLANGMSITTTSTSYSQSKDWVWGAMIEWQLTPSWSLEADGLFRTLHMTRAAVFADGHLGSVSPSPVITWEFPILAKYRLPGGRVRPFIEGGPSFRTAGNLNGTNPSHFGVSGGVGVETHWLGLNFAPTLRYTRWTRDDPNGVFAQPITRQDQLELLLTVSRTSESHWRPLGGFIQLGVVAGTNLSADYGSETRQYVFDPSQYQYDPVPDVFPVNTRTSSGPKSFLAGPSAEFLLPRRLSVETDAIYRPVGATYITSYNTGARTRSDSRFITWEFPVLAKYRLVYRGLAPFVGVGPNFRLTQSLTSSSPYGVVAAAGVEFRVGSAKISPSVRYTHWGRDTPLTTGATVTRNQAVFLLGLSF